MLTSEIKQTSSRFLSPHVLVRVAGLPFEAIERLALKQTMASVRKLVELQRAQQDAQAKLEAHLFVQIKAETDDKVRKKMINVKRDFSRGRQPKDQEMLERLLVALSPEERADYEVWQELRSQRLRLQEALPALLQDEMNSVRETLQELADDEEFKKGVLLSSTQLFEKIGKFIDTPLHQQNAKLRKIEKMLIVYLSRMAMKTSPFSTFTPVSFARLEDAARLDAMRVQDREPKHTHVTINHLSLTYLIARAEEHPELQAQIPLALNSTLKTADGKIVVFQTNFEPGSEIMKSTVNNEAFVSFSSNDTIETILRLVRESEGKITLSQLSAQLAGPAATPEILQQVLAFLRKLVQLQVLICRFDVPDDASDILRTWGEQLAGMTGPVAEQLKLLLHKQHELLHQYGTLVSANRAAVLNQMTALHAQMCEVLEAPVRNYEPILFEDTSYAGAIMSLHANEWAPMQDDMSVLQGVLPVFSIDLSFVLTFKEYFKRTFGTGGQCVDLLEMLEEYRKFFQSKYTNWNAPSEEQGFNPYNLAEIEHAEELKREFLQYVTDRIASADREVELDRGWLLDFAQRVPESIKLFSESFSYFSQPYRNAQGQLRLVVNRMASGYGQFMSRFGPMYRDSEDQPTFAESMRDTLRKMLPEGHTFAELNGVFGFNGNLHQPLAPYEVTYPGIKSSREEQERLALADLTLFHSVEDDRLLFKSKRTGEIIHPIYLGFLTWFLLPSLYRLLFLLVPSNYFSLPLANTYYQSLSPERKQEVVCIPQVRLNNLVLVRRQWWVPVNHAPQAEPSMSDLDFLVECQRWREKHDMQRHVFIRLSSGIDKNEVGENAPLKDDRPETDLSTFNDALRKPQYIDFDNLLLVKLLEKSSRRVNSRFIMEEMLPGPDELFVHGNNGSYVSELLLELNDQMLDQEVVADANLAQPARVSS
ncbi:MAG: lantibiotic dehydratase [Tumebacillaceae bacterium]